MITYAMLQEVFRRSWSYLFVVALVAAVALGVVAYGLASLVFCVLALVLASAVAVERHRIVRHLTLLSAVIESSDRIVVVKDLNSRILAANAAFLQATGHQSVAEVIGMTDAQAFGLAEGHEPLRGIQERDREALTLPAGNCLDREETLVFPDGKSHVLRSRRRPIHSATGQLLGLSNLAMDITEYKALNEALHNEHMELATIYESVPVMLCLIDGTGMIRYANPAVSRYTGRAPQEILHTNACDALGCVFSPNNSLCRDTDYVCRQCGLRDNFSSAFFSGACHHNTEHTITMSHGGSSRDVVLLVSTARVGELSHDRVLICLQDVTTHRCAETALRASEERLRRMFDQAPIGAAMIALDHRFKLVNKALCEILGYPAEVLCTLTAEEITHPDYLESDRANNAALVAGDIEYYDLEKRCIRRDGKEVWVRVNARLLRNADNSPAYFLPTMENITDRKRSETVHEELEEQLRQALKMEAVGRLAGGVAHDFNNMLAVILGRAELVLYSDAIPELLKHDVEEIVKAGQRSSDLTRQLLAFARKQATAPRRLDLNETVSSMLSMLRRLIGEDIDLLWVPGEDLWRVHIDPTQVDQILANLIVNARDAIKTTGNVTIETRNILLDRTYCEMQTEVAPGEYVLLAVSDDGSGMSGETSAHIFEPFFTTKELGRGTGLGLSTVYGIVKQNNGAINVYSEIGSGTTFKIYLPRYDGGTEYTESGVESELKGGTETILLVEDESAVLELCQRMLARLGYTVITVAEPKRSMEIARQYEGEIHLLITDVVMPELSGKEIFRDLARERSGIRCLYMSGYTADVIAHHGILNSGVHFLQKPFTLASLEAKVREALDA